MPSWHVVTQSVWKRLPRLTVAGFLTEPLITSPCLYAVFSDHIIRSDSNGAAVHGETGSRQLSIALNVAVRVRGKPLKEA